MDNQVNWYKTFFNGLAIEMWHNAVPVSYTEAEIKFIKEVTNLKAGAQVLDVPCGSGRHSIALAKEGYSLTGIDISAGNIKMLEEAKGALNIQAICADILEYPLAGAYDLAICLGNSFSYFPYSTMVKFLQKVYNVLKPGSQFVINSGAIAESILPNLKISNSMVVGDILFAIENNYLPETRILRTEMQFSRGIEIEKKTSYHYIYTMAEIKLMLLEAGFTKVIFYGGIDKTEYRDGGAQAYIVAYN